MTTFIYGGSNSLHKIGWTAGFTEKLAPGTVINGSIGAASSLMAMFRMVTIEGRVPQAGDTVIWEYALNEAHHVTRGLDVGIAMRNVERFIRECARRGLKFVAAVFTPRSEELADQRMPMYARLEALLDHYGVARFDVSTAWRAAKSLPHLPESLYLDEAHYGADPELAGFIQDGMIAAMAHATVPPLPTPLRSGLGALTVQLFEGEGRFANALISVPVAPVRARMVLGSAGRVIGLCALAHPNAQSAIRLELNRIGHAGSWLNLSTSGVEGGDKVLLKAFSLEAAVGGTGWQVAPGDRLNLMPVRVRAPLYAEVLVRKNLTEMDETQKPAFIGLILEGEDPA
jgi:hypothetical protein